MCACIQVVHCCRSSFQLCVEAEECLGRSSYVSAFTVRHSRLQIESIYTASHQLDLLQMISTETLSIIHSLPICCPAAEWLPVWIWMLSDIPRITFLTYFLCYLDVIFTPGLLQFFSAYIVYDGRRLCILLVVCIAVRFMLELLFWYKLTCHLVTWY